MITIAVAPCYIFNRDPGGNFLMSQHVLDSFQCPIGTFTRFSFVGFRALLGSVSIFTPMLAATFPEEQAPYLTTHGKLPVVFSIAPQM